MRQVVLMAVKDLRLLFRDRTAAFFILGFPALLGLFFGLIFSGPGDSSSGGKMKVALVDEDRSEYSSKFTAALQANASLQLEPAEEAEARESVRLGRRIAMLIIPAGFGESAGIFWQQAPAIQLGVDPSRSAEGAMLEGFVMEASGQLVADRFQAPAEFKPLIAKARQDAQSAADLPVVTRQLLSTLFGSVETVLDSMEGLQEQEDDASQNDASPGRAGRLSTGQHRKDRRRSLRGSAKSPSAACEGALPLGHELSAGDALGRYGLRRRLHDFHCP